MQEEKEMSTQSDKNGIFPLKNFRGLKKRIFLSEKYDCQSMRNVTTDSLESSNKYLCIVNFYITEEGGRFCFRTSLYHSDRRILRKDTKSNMLNNYTS